VVSNQYLALSDRRILTLSNDYQKYLKFKNMIWHIAKKDFLLNIISARFIVGFLLCLILVPFTIRVSIDEYKSQLRIYAVDKERADKEWKDIKVYSNLKPQIIKYPEPLSIFCKGISQNVGNKVKIYLQEYPLFPTGHASTRDNPLLNAFFSLDFITILIIILSLLAMVFSYDLITREQEDGTLKLVFTNQNSRISFLVGKVTGILISLLPILVFCFLLSALLIVISPDIKLQFTDWIRVAILFVFSILYLLVFILMGTLISAMVKHSSTAIVLSMLCWIWFVFLWPVSGSYLSKSLVKTELYDNVRNSLNDLDKEYWKKEGEQWDGIQKRLNMKGTSWWNATGGEDGYFETTGSPSETMKFHLLLNTWKEPVRLSYADRKWAIQKKYLDGLIRQQRVEQNLSWLSPSEIFGQASSCLCRSSEKDFLGYMDKVRRYREAIVSYLKERKLFEAYIYFTPQDPATFVSTDDYVKGNFKVPDHFNTLDLKDVPQFADQPAGLSESLKDALSGIAVFIVISVLLLLCSILVFNRYQLR
jgi:ABC-type transport system involved in multi-copper enzyme maturation permease subunit